MVCSPAKRAQQTAIAVAREIRFSEAEIVWEERLYASDISTVLDVVRKLDDKFEQAMLLGHNPSFLDVANLLTGGEVSHFPTAAVLGVKLDLVSWKDISAGSGKILFFEYPKKYTK